MLMFYEQTDRIAQLGGMAPSCEQQAGARFSRGIMEVRAQNAPSEALVLPSVLGHWSLSLKLGFSKGKVDKTTA